MPTTLQNTNVLFNDSSTQGTAWTGYRAQIFTSSGTFTIPTGVTALKITVVGGGGGSRGWSYGPAMGAPAGGTAIKYLTGLTPGNTLAVTIGSGGTAGGSGGSAGSGGNSTVASGTQTISTITGNGGGGVLNNGTIPSPGSASGGDLNVPGGFGIYGVGYFSCSAITLEHLAGGSSLLGLGGRTAGQGYGSGGGVNNGFSNGYAGAAGVVVFEW